MTRSVSSSHAIQRSINIAYASAELAALFDVLEALEENDGKAEQEKI